MKAVVTPCIRKAGISRVRASGEARSSPTWLCGSMKPGATIMPLASMTRRAGPASLLPTASMRSPATATSPTNGASEPV
jgi:hypothetical protein